MRASDVYAAQTPDARDALSAGPVVLSGIPGSWRSELAADLASSSPRLDLYPARAGTAAGLRADAALSLVRLIDRHSPQVSPRQFRALLAESFGDQARSAHAVSKGDSSSTLTFDEIVDAIPPRALLVVHDAHLLAEPWAERALWTLRARSQQRGSPRVLMLTRPWHASRLTGPAGAFFGFAETVELQAPGLARWLELADAELTDHTMGPDDLAWLLSQTRGIPRPTIATLQRMRGGERDARAAWTAHVSAQAATAHWIDRLAYGLHPYGPRLLTAIAANEPVYPSVPDARTDAIATALRTMRDHDLIYQPARRRWVVADPTLVAHLAAYGAAATAGIDR